MQQADKLCLLLVEADAEEQAFLAFSFRRAGYNLLVATSEEGALAYIAREHIHLVLLGDSFAAQQGFALCAKLRRLTRLPIVIVAPLNHPDDLATAFRLGMDDYIIKPLPFNVLLARLVAVLRRARKNTPTHHRGQAVRSAGMVRLMLQ